MEGTPDASRNRLSHEGYEAEVRSVLEEVVALQDAFLYAARKGMTKAKLYMLHDGLDAVQERLQELDSQTGNPAASRERQIVTQQIDDLRLAYPMTMATHGEEVSAAREAHHKAEAVYSSIQHRLTPEDRGQFRGRLAQLAAQVRHLEQTHWHRLLTAPVAPPKPVSPDYYKGHAFVHAAAQLIAARMEKRKA